MTKNLLTSLLACPHSLAGGPDSTDKPTQTDRGEHEFPGGHLCRQRRRFAKVLRQWLPAVVDVIQYSLNDCHLRETTSRLSDRQRARGGLRNQCHSPQSFQEIHGDIRIPPQLAAQRLRMLSQIPQELLGTPASGRTADVR
jgi:hypothetical protein